MCQRRPFPYKQPLFDTLTTGPSGGNNPWTRSTVNRNRVRALHKRTRHTATLASTTDDDTAANVCQRPLEALVEVSVVAYERFRMANNKDGAWGT